MNSKGLFDSWANNGWSITGRHKLKQKPASQDSLPVRVDAIVINTITMSCPLRPKKKYTFLFWEFDVSQPHEWDILKVGVHIPGTSDRFKVHKKCKHCGKFKKDHFVEHEELLRMGMSKEEIEEALHVWS